MGIIKDTIIGRYLSPNGSNYNIRRGYLNEITEIFADYNVGDDSTKKQVIEEYKRFIKDNLTFEKIVDMLAYYIFEDINIYVNGNGQDEFIVLEDKEYKMIKEMLRRFDERLVSSKNVYNLNEPITISEDCCIAKDVDVEYTTEKKKRGRPKKN